MSLRCIHDVHVLFAIRKPLNNLEMLIASIIVRIIVLVAKNYFLTDL